jgi:hypothetical protein
VPGKKAGRSSHCSWEITMVGHRLTGQQSLASASSALEEELVFLGTDPAGQQAEAMVPRLLCGSPKI